MQVGSSSARRSSAARLQCSDPFCFFYRIQKKQLTSEAELAHSELLKEKVMRLRYTRAQVKHLLIFQNQTYYNFDNVCKGSRPDLVDVGLLNDADFACVNKLNPFNFQNFGVNRLEMRLK